MDQERERIQADLRGLLEGEVRCDDAFVNMYASDASIFEVRPLGVVRPRGTADVVACVEYAAEHRLPLHARGAGTGVAGESLGPGLVIDFAHSMRRILEVENDLVRLQPGVVLGQLNRHLSAIGRVFGPDPANAAVTTMGSVLALDAAGSRWLQYGSARQHVVSLQAVLANGQVVRLEPCSIAAAATDDGPRGPLVRQTAELIQANAELIAQRKPANTAQRYGYRLDDVRDGDRLDLAKLLVGSEGTLALMTEATVRIEPLPRCSGVALLLFERLEQAAHAAIEIPTLGVTACDLLDRRLLRLACESDVRYDLLLPEVTEALLLVEKIGESPAEVRDGLLRVIHHVRRRRRLAFDAKLALEPDDVALYWRLPQRVVPTLYRLKGSTRPLPFVEDIVVPPAQLPDFFVRLQNVLKKHQVTASLFGHVGHGQLHVRPFLDLGDPDHVRRMQHLARDLNVEVLAVGGTISGEHGAGLSRTWFLREQSGPLYSVFAQLKKVFDPEHILNPGKILDDSGQGLTQNLRPVSAVSRLNDEIVDSNEPDAILQAGNASVSPDAIPLELNWSTQELMYAARSCNGCGACRTTAATERMCPIFRFQPEEEASPRAKANLMRSLLTGRLESSWLKSDALKQLADLCVNCHQCRLECPAEVDIPRLMVECKAQYIADNGLSLSDWFVAHLDRVAAWASLIRPFANWTLGSPRMRWLLEKTCGVARGRKLPRLAPRSFIRQAARRRMTRPARHTERKVLYLVDVYANWFDTQLAESLVTVMEHNGVSVYVPPEQQQAGMALISLGAVGPARRIARHNVQLLADAVRQGYHVVATEPAAALALTREYLYLLDDEDAQLVAAHTSEACSYLWKMHQLGQLELDLKPINVVVGYHQPCHLRALGAGRPGEHLLRLIPGVTVRPLEHGCSAMAGTYGLKSENYRSSLRAGRPLISAMRHPAVQIGASECSSCKLQMEQGTSKPTLHPLKLLALAYGKMPEVQSLLSARSQELIAT